MTIKELIKQLEKFSSDKTVRVDIVDSNDEVWDIHETQLDEQDGCVYILSGWKK